MTRSQVAKRVAGVAIVFALVPPTARAQRGGLPPPQSPRLAAPIALAGYWMSLVTED
jgi:hypothetical protein